MPHPSAPPPPARAPAEDGASARQMLLSAQLGEECRAKLAPVLGRTEFQVESATSLQHAAWLARLVRFDAVLVGAGEDDEDVLELLASLRRPASASVGAAVVLLLPPGEMPLARAYVSAGASQVVPTALGATDLQSMVLRLLHAKVRLEVRAMARLTVQLGGSTSQVLCQTRDLSRNGMFVVTDARPEIGSPIPFVLELSSSGVALRGDAQVVRHIAATDTRPEGLGLRFDRFVADGESRLAAFLDQRREATASRG